MNQAQLLLPKERREISILNVFLCCLVIFIHVSSAPITQLNPNSFQYLIVMVPWRLSAFVVQAFFLLSGIKFFLKREFHYKTFYLSRCKKILLPYILWVIAYYIYFVLHHYFAFNLKDLCHYLATGTLASHFYFIIALLQFYLLMPLWRFLCKKIRPIPLLLGALLINLFVLKFLPGIAERFLPNHTVLYDRIFITYIFYWLAGCCIGLHYKTFLAMLCRWRKLLLVGFVLAALVNVFLSKNKSLISSTNLDLVHFIYCNLAIFACYALTLSIKEHRIFESSLFQRINKASFTIYLSHVLVINIINEQLYYHGIIDIGACYLLRMIFTYLFTIGLCVIWNQKKEQFLQKHNKHKKSPVNTIV